MGQRVQSGQYSCLSGGELIPAYKIDQMKQAVTDPTIPQLMTNANGTDWSFWNFGDLTSVGNTNWIDEHFGKTPSRRNITSVSPVATKSMTSTSRATSSRARVFSSTATTTASATP